jgi:medium-chain acyl-[acyl-carrier-protein] hydrolase
MTRLPGTNPWLLPVLRSQRPMLRLFCFPCAGGWGQMFYPWARQLSGDIDVWAIQLPGRAMRVREVPRTCMRALSQEVALAIASHIGVPYAFFGHSMGALLAFEVARRLRALRCRGPEHLFLSSAVAPDLGHLRPPLHTLSDEEIVMKLVCWNGMPPELTGNAEILEVLLPTLRSDFRLCDTYEYVEDAPLDVPVTVLGGEADEEVPIDALHAWQRQTAGPCSVQIFPGGHFYFSAAESDFFALLTRELGHIINREKSTCQR